MLSLVFAVAGTTPAAQQAARPAPDVQSYRVQGNVWLIHTPASNVAVQIGDDGVLVVDTATAAYADQVLAEIRRLANGKTIRYIVTTHAHRDHTGGHPTI